MIYHTSYSFNWKILLFRHLAIGAIVIAIVLTLVEMSCTGLKELGTDLNVVLQKFSQNHLAVASLNSDMAIGVAPIMQNPTEQESTQLLEDFAGSLRSQKFQSALASQLNALGKGLLTGAHQLELEPTLKDLIFRKLMILPAVDSNDQHFLYSASSIVIVKYSKPVRLAHQIGSFGIVFWILWFLLIVLSGSFDFNTVLERASRQAGILGVLLMILAILLPSCLAFTLKATASVTWVAVLVPLLLKIALHPFLVLGFRLSMISFACVLLLASLNNAFKPLIANRK